MKAKSTSCPGWRAVNRAPNRPFSIGTLNFQGGGRIGVCSLPGRDHALQIDLDVITAWSPAIIVSMTEQSEMEAAGSWRLGETLARWAIEWAHLPIRDFGGLEGANAAAWPGLSARLHKIIDAQKSVLLHCRGGHGRSGMIALRLMIERGEDAETALSRLRTARPGAIETAEQLDWAQGGERSWPAARLDLAERSS